MQCRTAILFLVPLLISAVACSEDGPEGAGADAVTKDLPNNAQKAARPEVDPEAIAAAAEEQKKKGKFPPMVAQILGTKERFYGELKALVKNPRLPPDPMKEAIRDLYAVYEKKFMEYGYKLAKMGGGDARSIIIPVDNTVTATPIGQTVWIEIYATKHGAVDVELGELILGAHTLMRCYNFELLKKLEPERAKRLGILK